MCDQVSLVAQVKAQQVGDVGIVFDDQHMLQRIHGRFPNIGGLIVAKNRGGSYHI
jgi:hypothetical protein